MPVMKRLRGTSGVARSFLLRFTSKKPAFRSMHGFTCLPRIPADLRPDVALTPVLCFLFQRQLTVCVSSSLVHLQPQEKEQ